MCGWIAFLVIFAVWIGSTDNFVLRDQLRRWQFWFLELQFVSLLALTAINLAAFVRSLRFTRTDYFAMGGAAALIGMLAGGVAPLTNRIYYDEQIYQGIAQNLADLRLAQMCNDGTVEYGQLQCWRGEYNKQTYGYPYLLSVVYRIGGAHYWTAPRVNVLCAALMVVLVYLLAAALFDDRRVARASALIAALIPQQLLWSHTASAETSAALFNLFAVVTAVYFIRTRTTPALLWMVAATVFAIQFRTESILVAAVIALAIAVWAPDELRSTRLWAASLAGAILATALLAHLFAVRNEGWGTTGDRFSLQYLGVNLRANGPFYVVDWRFPALYTLLGACGLILSRTRRTLVLPAVYFLVFFSVYLFFYAGSYSYGADVRFSLMTYPPLAVLAGAGGVELIRRAERFSLTPARAETAFVALLAVQFLWYLPLVRGVGEEAWAARADVAFSEHVIDSLSPNATVLTHNPSVFHLMGRNAAQLSIAVNESGYVHDVLMQRYAGGVFLHWNFWCNVADKVQQDFCASARDKYSTTVFKEYRERDYHFVFYRMERAAAASGGAATSAQNEGNAVETARPSGKL